MTGNGRIQENDGFKRYGAIPFAVMVIALVLTAGTVAAEPIRIGLQPGPTIHRETEMSALERRLATLLAEGGGRITVLGRPDQLLLPLRSFRESGLLRDLVFVLPDETSLHPESKEWFRSVLEQEAIPVAELDAFRFDNGIYFGESSGCRFSFQALPDMAPAPPGRVLLVDTRFLLGLYRNPVGTPIVTLARKLIETVANARLEATSVLIYDPVEDPSYPLENGFMAWLLADLISNPSSFSGGIPRKWERFEVGESASHFLLYREAYQAYQEYLESDPGDASIHYRIAKMAALDRAEEFAIGELDVASRLDPAYRRAYAELARTLAEKGMETLAQSSLKAGLARFPADPLIATELARLHMYLGEKALHLGSREEAVAHLQAAAEVDGADPELRSRARGVTEALRGAP